MRYLFVYFFLCILMLFASCDSDSGGVLGDGRSTADEAGGFGGSFDGVSSSGGGGDTSNTSGLITASEWNDLDNWQFWLDLNNVEDYADKSEYWGFYTTNRVAVLLSNSGAPVADAEIVLLNNGSEVWKAKSDNHGRAELWLDLFQEGQAPDMSNYSLLIDGRPTGSDVKLYAQGINELEISQPSTPSEVVDLSFIVDATGSMSDELEFLKDDLEDVIRKVQDENSSLQIRTSSVFYRDEGDDYVEIRSEFSSDLQTTLGFINAQSAGGGGDTPEAVHTAMKASIEELQWSERAKARIAFLVLDASPHYKPEVLQSIQQSITVAAEKGIKIIPISASGVTKDTEFLMRFFSISTNGTYVFITNDSGIGNDHIEASVGETEVEFLNELMQRLIQKYTD